MKAQTLRKLFAVAFVGLIIAFAVALYLQPKDACLREIYNLDHQLEGKVTRKFQDGNRSNIETIDVQNPDGILNFICSKEELAEFYEYAQEGDSLFKPKGSTDIRLFRNDFDTTIVVYYDCDK